MKDFIIRLTHENRTFKKIRDFFNNKLLLAILLALLVVMFTRKSHNIFVALFVLIIVNIFDWLFCLHDTDINILKKNSLCFVLFSNKDIVGHMIFLLFVIFNGILSLYLFNILLFIISIVAYVIALFKGTKIICKYFEDKCKC